MSNDSSSSSALSNHAKLELTILAISLVAVGALTPPDVMPWWAKYAVGVAGAVGGAIRIALGISGK